MSRNEMSRNEMSRNEMSRCEMSLRAESRSQMLIKKRDARCRETRCHFERSREAKCQLRNEMRDVETKDVTSSGVEKPNAN